MPPLPATCTRTTECGCTLVASPPLLVSSSRVGPYEVYSEPAVSTWTELETALPSESPSVTLTVYRPSFAYVWVGVTSTGTAPLKPVTSEVPSPQLTVTVCGRATELALASSWTPNALVSFAVNAIAMPGLVLRYFTAPRSGVAAPYAEP